MKALEAHPKKIRKIFADEYIIPDYQRPYTWDEEQCEKLWDDLEEFWTQIEGDQVSQSKNEEYFLGTITLCKDSDSQDSFWVIDGQQRLISLSLLIKALYRVARTYGTLQEYLLKKDPVSGKLLKDEPRVESQSVEEDNAALKQTILPNGEEILGDSPFAKNYKVFEQKINEWHGQENEDSQKLHSFIATLLNKVVLLPVECGSQEDALTIFETLNDRGTPLNDTDIFKVKMYKNISSQKSKQKFIKTWNGLKDHLRLFRVYMHLLRSADTRILKETALRKYFDKKKKVFNNYDNTTSVLKKLDHINQGAWEVQPTIKKWWKILQFYPNDYWQYPLYVFLHKYADDAWDGDGNLKIEVGSELAHKFEELIQWTVKYFYIKGVNHNSVNTVKDTTFKVCRNIMHGKDYRQEYKNNLEKDNDLEEFKRRIESFPLRRYERGIILIGAGLNDKQSDEDFCSILDLGLLWKRSKLHIEHILPRDWINYDGWTKEDYDRDIQRLGNLVPCEWKINISASNEFFRRKQEKYYKKSKVQDVLDLSKQEPIWSPATLADRHNKIVKRITDFFCNF